MSACPKCATPREERDGPYFICPDCRWRWTVSITGQVYVQQAWPPPGAPGEDQHVIQLLHSVDGLTDQLSALRTDDSAGAATPDDEPAQPDLPRWLVDRLRVARAATEAGYYNEGVPLDRLRTEGVPLILPPDTPKSA